MKLSPEPVATQQFLGLFKNYTPLPTTFDEFFSSNYLDHPYLHSMMRYFDAFSVKQFASFHATTQELFRQKGVTFNVYSEKSAPNKIFPFDLIPRVILKTEWEAIERGLVQRVKALNHFLRDIYGQQRIIKEGRIPREIVLSSKGYLPQLKGVTPPQGIYIHIAGIDLIREDIHFNILEDNLKVPSGVSYVLENRGMSETFFPAIFNEIPILEVNDYPLRLKEALQSLVPASIEDPLLVVLTPGPYNAAYFEHLFLSRRMGCPLVQNHDLIVRDDHVYLKDDKELKRVDVIYRRTDDEYLDPTVFNPNSLLGIPGLIKAYMRGHVILANAPGNGVADDKAIYPYVPEMIRFYLDEESILPQVETYSCTDPKALEHVLNNLSSSVIKIVNQSGGYGITIGAQASKAELQKVKERILANPRDYIAQPLKQLSTCPTAHNEGIFPRRVDFRPFIITGTSTWVLPGGLTRVALNENSFIVNSSQGGGSKDTWVLGS